MTHEGVFTSLEVQQLINLSHSKRFFTEPNLDSNCLTDDNVACKGYIACKE